MKRSSILFLCAAFAVACGSTNTTNPVGPGPETGGTITVTGLSDTVTAERFTGFDQSGRVLFGPVTLEHQQVQRLQNLPLGMRSLEIEQLLRTGLAEGEFFTQVNFAEQRSLILSSPAFVPNHDPTSYRFVFFGCNRISGSGASGNPSTANRAQLSADFQEIANLVSTPRYLFFTGDLVLNEVAGNTTLQNQLTAWVQEYQAGPLASSPVQLCAMTGNHEVLVQTGSDETTELPNPSTLPVWVQIMKPYLLGNNGPTTAAPNPDRLTHDQSELSYTFIDGEVGFMALNTDTFTTDNVNSQIPLSWISGQLDALQSNPAVKHIFVLGHRLIVSIDPDNLGIQPQQASLFQTMLGGHSKVRAYLCAHAHAWNYQKLGNLP